MFEQIREEVFNKLFVDGVYKSGKLNSSQNLSLIKKIDELLIPGCISRSEKIQAIRLGISELPKCYCGNYCKINITKLIVREYCSPKCAANSEQTKAKRQKTNLQKYGTEHAASAQIVRNKIEKTSIDRYGKKASWANETVRNKMMLTNKEKYGFANPAQSPQIKKKLREIHASRSPDQIAKSTARAKNTCMEKYGVDHPMKTDSIITKIRDAIIYNCAFTRNQLQLFLEKIETEEQISPMFSVNDWDGFSTQYKWMHNECGKSFNAYARNGRSIQCPFCRRKSKVQQFVESVLHDAEVEFIVEDRLQISPYEIDCYIPSANIGIEVNGVYWHHEDSVAQPLLKKTEMFSGQLLHFWDFEIQDNPEIVKNIILAKLKKLPKVFARKLQVRQIDSETAKAFFNQYHLQGNARASAQLGLYDGDKLLCAASFGRERFSRTKHWELIRFATAGVAVIGGLSRLIKHFAVGRNGEKLVTFADRRISNGLAYLTTGFELLYKTQPSYFYSKGVRLSRYEAQKSKLRNIVADFDETLTERELMARDGWLKCIDCGNLKFIKDL